MSIIQDKTYSHERALYSLKDSTVLRYKFEGKEDGESVLKETRNVKVKESYFALRYPLWHAMNYEIRDSVFDTTSRASLWYSYKGNILSIKNPRSGHIYVDSVDKIIKEEAVMTCTGEVIIRNK